MTLGKRNNWHIIYKTKTLNLVRIANNNLTYPIFSVKCTQNILAILERVKTTNARQQTIMFVIHGVIRGLSAECVMG